MATEKMSSNKVFSFGRDHGYHGRLLSHGVVAEQSLHVKENTLTGYCFTPQDGNALLSSVAGTVQPTKMIGKRRWRFSIATFSKIYNSRIQLWKKLLQSQYQPYL